MGVSLEIWRSRIGSYNCCGSNSALSSLSMSFPPVLQAFYFLILLILLIIGNIELNPGPNMNLKKCNLCNFEAVSVDQHLKHQRFHEANFNHKFVCPFESCLLVFTSFPNVNAHVSHHGSRRDAVVDPATPSRPELQCAICNQCFASLKLLITHLMEHSKNGAAVSCPLSNECNITRSFATVSQFRPHISHHHPGWKEDSVPMQFVAHQLGNEERQAEDSSEVHQPEDSVHPSENIEMEDESYWETDEESDSDSELAFQITDDEFENDLVVRHLAKFYAMLEGKLLISGESVQKISKYMAFLSEVLQAKLKVKLVKHLKDLKIDDNDVSMVLNDILSNDVLYNTHHRTGLQDNLSSNFLRKKYFKENLDYVEHVEDNLNRVDPTDRSNTVMYVPIKETLKLMLQDPSVQAEIESSFNLEADPNVIKDYTDGTVFKGRDVPKKRIDIFIFQDAFNCANVLGSAKRKYKMCGVYMTLGNFKPFRRSRLRAKRLISIIDDKIFSNVEKGIKKAFRLLVKDLKVLEQNGIMYKDELLPVRLQFILGDNLGQHEVGGFMGGFSAEYFCRYCMMTMTKYNQDKQHRRPTFRTAKIRTKERYQKALRKLARTSAYSYKGVKYNSAFNELDYFHVSDPGMPCCLGHDLFIGGVVDCDMASMISYFVSEGFFSYDYINRSIRAFKCKGGDTGNKPAPLIEGKKKTGGHAVQNWTLLRLLPFLVGEKVDVTDKVWKLYLLLKHICQLACSPALSLNQINELGELIKKYMKRRYCLANNYKPKHHFFSHLAQFWKWFGPPIHLWTLGFEQFHRFFKRVTRTCNCYINVPFTLVTKHQLYQAYLNTGTMFSSVPILDKPFPLTIEDQTEEYKPLLENAGFQEGCYTAKKITLNDMEYQLKNWLLLGNVPGEDSIFVGRILLMVCDQSQKCHVILKKEKAQFRPEYGLYSILDKQSELTLTKLDELENPCPASAYKFNGKLSFSLKSSFVQ